MLWLAVALGGSLGAMGRYAVSLAFAAAGPGKLPWATLTVNVIGSFFMGIFFVLILHKGILPAAFRQPLMVGFLGAFTTFSSFSIEVVELLQIGQWHWAMLYMALSVVLCVLAAFLGFTLTDTFS